MVFLHAHQAGVAPRRVTLDLDAVADARTVARATTSLTAALLELGWQLPDENVSTDQLGYRFVLRTPGTQSHPAGPDLSFDMLVPEGLGPRTDTTTVPPARAVAIPGASRALARTSRQPVVLGSRHGTVPRPDLLGALVIKSLAAVRDRGTSIDPTRRPERHLQDLALLYAVVPDPGNMRRDVTAKDRRQLAAAPEPAWHALGDPDLVAAGIGDPKTAAPLTTVPSS
jgi:hypothetical protein